MLVLLLGILSTGIIGIYTGTAFFDWFGAMGTGITGMGELIISTLLAGGMLETIRYNGGIDFIISRLTRHVSGKRGAEFSIAALVGIANLCTANNTIAIITTGPIAKDIALRFLRSANADSLRTCRHFTHQHHRKPVLPLLHGNMRHTRHSAEIPQEILGRRMSDK